MIVAWMLFSLITGGLIAAAAWAAAAALQHAGRPARFAWVAGVITTVAWPALAIGALRLFRASAVSVAMATGGRPVSVLPPLVIDASRVALPVTLDGLLAILWVATSIALLGRIALLYRRVRRERRGWARSEVEGTPVRISSSLGPAVVGLSPGEIVLPRWMLSVDRALLRLVLQHELEHRRAGDPAVLFSATIVSALLPWHVPLLWQVRRLRLAIEMDCDARVLSEHPFRERYQHLLLAIAHRRASAAQPLPAIAEPTSDLERRIIAMQRLGNRPTRAQSLAWGAAALAALSLACSIRPPEGPEPSARTGHAIMDEPVQAFFEFQVDTPAVVIPGTPTPPSYPAELSAAGVEGEVLLQFVVSREGRFEPATVKVARATDARFVEAVMQVLPTFRFHPAIREGEPVPMWIQLPFLFRLDSRRDASSRR